MQFIKVGNITDFEIIKIKSFSMLGRKVGVIKRSDGSFYAIEVGCKHQGADLTNGTIKAVCEDLKFELNRVRVLGIL